MRLSMRENSWQNLAARPLRAQITRGWCSWAQQHTKNTYRLVQKGVITFHSYICNNYISLLFFVSTYVNQSFPVQPAACHKSANSSETFLTNKPNTRPVECPSSLPLSGSSADSTVWDPEGDTSRSEQLTSSPASMPTNRLTDWLRGRLDDWLPFTGGSRTESHSPNQPADSLPGWRDGWMTSLMALPCLLSWCFTCRLCFCLNNWMKDWPTE